MSRGWGGALPLLDLRSCPRPWARFLAMALSFNLYVDVECTFMKGASAPRASWRAGGSPGLDPTARVRNPISARGINPPVRMRVPAAEA